MLGWASGQECHLKLRAPAVSREALAVSGPDFDGANHENCRSAKCTHDGPWAVRRPQRPVQKLADSQASQTKANRQPQVVTDAELPHTSCSLGGLVACPSARECHLSKREVKLGATSH